MQIAFDRLAIIITQDKDFGELSFRMETPHHGIILIRLSGLSSIQKGEIAVAVIKKHEMEFGAAFTVIFRDYVKIRKK